MKPQKVDPITKEKSRLTKEEWREFTKTVWHIANTSHGEHPAVFPREIPHRLIKLFSFHGETVLDPFAGTGTTALAALHLGRRAVCFDQNPRYTRIIAKRCQRLNGAAAMAEVITGDSRRMASISSGSIGLIVTSPPYWNKADYGGNGSNLGNEPVYTRFLENIRPAFEE